jgi:chromate reductase
MATAMIAIAPAALGSRSSRSGSFRSTTRDLDPDPPPAVSAFKQRIKRADAVLFVTPEYNRSVPGVLKNAIDIGSRPYGKSAWNGKPVAVDSVSPGAIGAFGANHALRQSFVFLNMPAMQQPEAYIGHAAKLFDDKGEFVADATRELMSNFLQAFAQWIERILS